MAKISTVINLLFWFCLLLIKTTSSSAFPLSLWNDFKRNKQCLIVSHSIFGHIIQFSERKTQDWQKSMHYGGEESIYIQYLDSNGNFMQLLSEKQNLAIKGKVRNQTIKISRSLWMSKKKETHQNYKLVFLLNKQMLNRDEIQVISQNEDELELRISFDMLVSKSIVSGLPAGFEAKKAQIMEHCELKINKFTKKFSLDDKNTSFIKAMMIDTLSQICQEETQFDRFYGLCEKQTVNKKTHKSSYKIDNQYSLLIIETLFTEYGRLGLWLFENMINLLEEKLLYDDSLKFLPVPEHIGIISAYVKKVKEMNVDLYSQNIQQFHRKIIVVLNQLINQFLLSNANILGDEKNYRENNQIHPTILKMLSLKWETNSLKDKLSSIYDESFTPDYWYHSSNDELDSAVGKTFWLISTVKNLAHFIKSFGTQQDQKSLEQIQSLYNILNHMSHNDERAKQGTYYSIAKAQGVRYYVTQIGYESLLPYTYDVSSVYPSQIFKNLTTQYGLLSLNLDHPQASQDYDYRGNIHLYFNYKILSKTLKRLANENNEKGVNQVNEVFKSIRQKILNSSQNNKVYSMWNDQGEGLKIRKSISLLNALFFKADEVKQK